MLLRQITQDEKEWHLKKKAKQRKREHKANIKKQKHSILLSVKIEIIFFKKKNKILRDVKKKFK